MNQEDRKEVKEMLHEILSGYQALNESQNYIVVEKLNGINCRLDVLNGKTQKTIDRVIDLEKSEVLHPLTCPNLNRIRTLEDNQLSTKAIKKWIVGSIAITGGIMSILFIIFKIVEGF